MLPPALTHIGYILVSARVFPLTETNKGLYNANIILKFISEPIKLTNLYSTQFIICYRRNVFYFIYF